MRLLASAFALSAFAIMLDGTAVAIGQNDDDSVAGFPRAFETEEVEPGVHRIINDGVRDLARPLYWLAHPNVVPGIAAADDALDSRIVAGQDGSVWLLTAARFFRLGDEETHAWESPLADLGSRTNAFTQDEVIVTRDGRLWLAQRERVRRFDDGGWTTVEPRLKKGFRVVATRIAPDGTVWALGERRRGGKKSRFTLAEFGADGWVEVTLPPGPPGRRQDRLDFWGFTHDGTLWASRGDRLSRYVDGEWTEVARSDAKARELVAGPDGTVWAIDVFGLLVARLEEGSWRRFRTDDPTGHSFGYPGSPPSPVSVDPDGRLWYATSQEGPTEDLDEFLHQPGAGCAGLAAFDGSVSRHFLEDMCIYDMDIAPDGRVWLQAGTWNGDRVEPVEVGPVETYAITPEAVAATE